MQPSYNSLRSVVRVPYALQPVDVIPASPHLVSAIKRHDRVATLVELPQARSLKERQRSYRVEPRLSHPKAAEVVVISNKYVVLKIQSKSNVGPEGSQVIYTRTNAPPETP